MISRDSFFRYAFIAFDFIVLCVIAKVYFNDIITDFAIMTARNAVIMLLIILVLT